MPAIPPMPALSQRVLGSFPKVPKFTVGTDICQISRIGRLLGRDPKSRKIESYPEPHSSRTYQPEFRDHLRVRNHASARPASGSDDSVANDARKDYLLRLNKAEKFLRKVLTREERIAMLDRFGIDDQKGTPFAGNLLSDIKHENGRVVPFEAVWKPGIVEFVAGRFAAKEAIIKTFHHRKLYYQDIEIRVPQWFLSRYGNRGATSGVMDGLHRSGRAPIGIVLPAQKGLEPGTVEPSFFGQFRDQSQDVETDDYPKTKLAAMGEIVDIEGGEREVSVSISHDGEYAIAVALAVEQLEHGTTPHSGNK